MLEPRFGEAGEPYKEKKPRLDDGDIKADHGKPRWDLIPIRSLEGIAEVLTYGAKKYNDNNWLKSDHPERYYAAAMRHLAEVRKGAWIDPESGLPHIDHANCCMVMYRELLIKQRESKTHGPCQF